MVKHGKDKCLEALANELLGGGSNKRSIDRDIEKRKYELGLIAREDLQHFDPDCDWITTDSAYSIVTDSSDVEFVDPSVCAEHDGNIRPRSWEGRLPDGVWGQAGEEERRGLSRHVEDGDDWGLTHEVAPPPLGVNDIKEGESKLCTKCGLRKKVSFFSPKADAKDGLHPWCKECRKDAVSQSRRNARSGA